jgi:ketosteroid isomerase-like protein
MPFSPGVRELRASLDSITEAWMSEHEIKSLRRIYEALSRWDVDDFVGDVTHDFEMVLPDALPWGGTRHGHDGMRTYATIFQEYVEGAWADPDEFFDAGDCMVVLGRLRGRAKASGAEYEVQFAHVWNLTDGMPSRCRGYYDTAPIMATLGPLT